MRLNPIQYILKVAKTVFPEPKKYDNFRHSISDKDL